jgi:hypothetical protein
MNVKLLGGVHFVMKAVRQMGYEDDIMVGSDIGGHSLLALVSIIFYLIAKVDDVWLII